MSKSRITPDDVADRSTLLDRIEMSAAAICFRASGVRYGGHDDSFIVGPNAWAELASLVQMMGVFKRRFVVPAEAATITPEDTLRDAGITDARQARYQRKMSTALSGRLGNGQ